ncbi:MAG TPA: thioredoxin domain-containing protein [Myxococcota bacterium]|nr:thioredoxin domain-containing protein [Myxococcota bacterium]
MKTGFAIVAAALVGLLVGYAMGRDSARMPEGLDATLAQMQADIAALKEARPAAPTPRRPSGPDPDKIHDVEIGESPVRGAADAKVTIVEFSDFQCPYCGRVKPTLTKLLEEYPDDVRVVYKHLPLSFHKDALPAAKAAVAAGKQGKFWEMHDALFEHQRELGDETYLEIARELGLDVEQFEKDYKSAPVATEVAHDMNEARRLGVTGTPGFFVNGRFASGARPYESFKAMVDQALAAKG